MSNSFSFQNFLDKLPSFRARSEVSKLPGGILSATTLANKDSLGEGPGVYKRIGTGPPTEFEVDIATKASLFST